MSTAKNELTTMYGGGFARLIDSKDRLYRLVNILEASVNFDSKQDFLRAIYPNSPSQVIAVATTENTVTLQAKMGEFTKEMVALASNLEYSLLNEATLPVINESHVMLTTRASLRYPHAGESTVQAYARDGGYEVALKRVAGLSYAANVAQYAPAGQTFIYVDDVAGYPTAFPFNVSVVGQANTVTAIDTALKKLTLGTPLNSNKYPLTAGAVVLNLTTGNTSFLTADSTAASYATGTVTISGTISAGDTVEVSVGAISAGIYTVLVTDTLGDVADGVAALIDALASVTASAVGTVITIDAVTPGTAGNLSLAAVDSGTIVATASGLTLTGGANSNRLVVSNPALFSVNDVITVGGQAAQYEVTDIDPDNDNPNELELDTDLLSAFFGAHVPGGLVTLIAAATTPGPDEFDVDGNDIVVHPKWKGKGISIDYERVIGGGSEAVAFTIGGDAASEIGYVDFHLVLQNQQGKWMYYRFPAAIPSGKWMLDMKGSFMNVPEEFTAVTPPGWAKPFLIIGEL